MHCVSTYPTNPKDVNLNTINALKKGITAMLVIVAMKMVSQFQLPQA